MGIAIGPGAPAREVQSIIDFAKTLYGANTVTDDADFLEPGKWLELFNRAARWVCEKVGPLTANGEGSPTYVLSAIASQGLYDLPRDVVNVRDITYSAARLTKATEWELIRQYGVLYRASACASGEVPKHWKLEDATQIRVVPKPYAAVSSAIVLYASVLPEWVTDGSLTSPLPPVFDEILAMKTDAYVAFLDQNSAGPGSAVEKGFDGQAMRLLLEVIAAHGDGLDEVLVARTLGAVSER
jgi:hypothetical protein